MKRLFASFLFLLTAVTGLAQGRGDVKTTDTLITLSNFPPSSVTGGVVATLGRATVGDGDGGVYVWDATSTATVDQVDVIGSSITGTGRWLLSIGSGTGGGGGSISDGDKGDITVSGTGAVWTVDPAAIAYSKIQDVSAASRLLGRGSASGSGDVEEISGGSGLTFNGTVLSVSVPLSSGDKGDITVGTPGGGAFTLEYDDASVAYSNIQNVSAASRLLGRGSSGGAGDVEELTLGSSLALSGTALNVSIPLTDGDKGDISVASSGTAWTIEPGAVTYSKMQDVSAASRLLGRGSASGSGDPQELTVSTGLTLSGTALSVSVPLSDGDKGDITVSSSGAAWAVDGRAITFPKMPAATAASVFGRSSGGGSGDASVILAGLGIDISSGEIKIDTNVLQSYLAGVSTVDSMADLVTAVTNTSHAKLYFVKSYYANRPGQGDGYWYWDPNSEYPVSGGVVASGRSGRMLPIFPNNKIDVTMFGAVTKAPTATNDNAFQAALFWQQDRTKGGVLYVPIGDYPISSTIRKKTKGTGSSYLVNGSYSIGATNILIDTGSGTFVAGDAVSFGTLLEVSSEEYRVIAYDSGSGTLQIAYPGLRASVNDNAAVTIHEVPRLAIVGDNHGVTSISSERSVSTSNIMMVTDNIPIIEIGGYHNLIQNLTLVYDNFQTSTQTGSACIYNPGSQKLYQAVISGVSMHRCAYGIHVATGDETAPNNWLYNILVETAAISAIYWDKSGTENWGGGWYLQNFGEDFETGAASKSQAFTGLNKTALSTEVTINVATLPGNIQVGSWIEISGTSLSGRQFIATYASAGQIKFNMLVSETATLVTGTTGTVALVVQRRSTKPQFYNIAQFDITGLDTEATRGSADANTPICIHNQQGKLTIHGMHVEYVIPDQSGQAVIKNNGGTINIGTVDIINSGRLDDIDIYMFQNTTADGGAPSSTNPSGVFNVGILSSRDLSLNTGGIGNWIVATNRASVAEVVIGQNHIGETRRNNATNFFTVGQAQTPTTATLTIP